VRMSLASSCEYLMNLEDKKSEEVKSERRILFRVRCLCMYKSKLILSSSNTNNNSKENDSGMLVLGDWTRVFHNFKKQSILLGLHLRGAKFRRGSV
jgi:hypothetical protein